MYNKFDRVFGCTLNYAMHTSDGSSVSMNIFYPNFFNPVINPWICCIENRVTTHRMNPIYKSILFYTFRIANGDECFIKWQSQFWRCCGIECMSGGANVKLCLPINEWLSIFLYALWWIITIILLRNMLNTHFSSL